MTIASAQATAFYETVVDQDQVFTFLDADSFLVLRIGNVEVIPFWSSKARLDAIQKQHVKYRAYVQDVLSLKKFLRVTLPLLEAENIHVGVNWSGERLTGYDVSVGDLRRNLAYWQQRTRNPSAR